MQGNPFTPGAGAQPPALVGRDPIIADFEESIERTARKAPHQGILFVGLRGVGKTVLLNSCVEQAKRVGFRSISLEATDNANFLRVLAQATRQTLIRMRPSRAIGDKVQHAMAVLKSFSLTIGTEGPRFGVEIDPALGYADTGDAELDLQDLFRAVGEAAEARHEPIIIAIDELQYLQRRELGALISAFHHTVQQSLPLLLIGGGLPNLRGLAGEAKTYAERLFLFPELGPLDRNDTSTALQKPAFENNVIFSDEALESIYELTHGYPYFVQEWAHDAWRVASGSPIGKDDVEAATVVVARRLDENFFRVRFDRLTDRERGYLRAMAELGQGPQRSGEIASAYGSSVTALAPLRDTLISKGMLYSQGHGTTAFSVPMFGEFMLRAIPTLTDVKQSRKESLATRRGR